MPMQLAAYETAYDDSFGEIENRFVLRIDKNTGKPEYREFSYDDMAHYYEMFYHLMCVKVGLEK
jgi:hypothetical protein